MKEQGPFLFAAPEGCRRVSEMMYELAKQNYLNYSYKVIVTGGCDSLDYEYMEKKLDELFWLSDEFASFPIKIVSGMDQDTDTLAIRYADEHQLTKILFPPNWKEYEGIVGFLRNEDMLSIATHLVAFWDGRSHSTKHMIEIARKKGIPVWVFEYSVE